MSQNVAKALPRDQGGEAMQEYPAPALALEQYIGAPTVSSVVSFTDNTTALEVGAGTGGGILMKWIASTDTIGSVIVAAGAGSNYDHFIPANTVRRFVIPQETQGVSSVVGRGVQAGLYRRVAWIAAVAPISSVFASEF